jgi:hypothetical protein
MASTMVRSQVLREVGTRVEAVGATERSASQGERTQRVPHRGGDRHGSRGRLQRPFTRRRPRYLGGNGKFLDRGAGHGAGHALPVRTGRRAWPIAVDGSFSIQLPVPLDAEFLVPLTLCEGIDISGEAHGALILGLLVEIGPDTWAGAIARTNRPFG